MPTIALVDDNPNILTSVSIALVGEGYRVQTYTDGFQALDGLRANPPDLAIFDIKMPRMDGIELLRRLRQKSDLPVIFLTSKDEEIDELFGLKMGADDFIHKPFSQRLLVERVKAILRRANPKDNPIYEDLFPKIFQRDHLRLLLSSRVCAWKEEFLDLTPSEFIIARFLASKTGAAFDSEQLQEEILREAGSYVTLTAIMRLCGQLRRKFRDVEPTFDVVQSRYETCWQLNIDTSTICESENENDNYTWDFFIAYASGDLPNAEKLYSSIRGYARVFLDRKCLKLGSDWDRELTDAQAKSAITVIIVSEKTDKAYYQREEIAIAISKARDHFDQHYAIPLYVDSNSTSDVNIPYGLRLKEGLIIPEDGDFASVAIKLLNRLEQMKAEQRIKKIDLV